MTTPAMTWTSERAIRVGVDDSLDVQARLEHIRGIADAVRAAALPWIEEIVPSGVSVLLHIDPREAPASSVIPTLQSLLHTTDPVRKADQVGRDIVIPVAYGGALGPDLADVASRSGLDQEAVISAHTKGAYTVEAVGFAPGFGYLIGLPESLHTPRLDSPRHRIPAGSVGIGGDRTGVYPRESPGGWRLIGRAASKLFDVTREPAALLAVGDRVRFKRVSSNDVERFWERQ